MSELEPNLTDARRVSDAAADEEVLDALPVLAEEARAIDAQRYPGAVAADRRSSGVMIPAVQAAAVAAGGFVAGAAVVGLVHRRQRRAATLAKGRSFGRDLAQGIRGGRRASRAGELVQIVGSRSLLVDVHLLGGSNAER